MVTSSDFLRLLEEDMAFKILTCLDTPPDLVRASCVSQSWRQFIITNGLCKGLCLRMFPQLSGVDHVTEPPNLKKRASEVGPSNLVEWENLEREHRVYAFLAHCCSSVEDRECISEAISASSTDNYPEEGIHNTLEVRDRVGRMASYWSSKGHKNPAAPETLIYKLSGDLCVVTEIGIKPFKAYFQTGHPIYSANWVRFRMGHQKTSMGVDDDLMDQAHHDSADEKFEWTYTSPEFPMMQDNQLQKFKLPEPVLCIGGILLVELLGRVQTQEMDGLFYICIAHVQVTGRPLSPFGVEPLEPGGKFVLKVQSYSPPKYTEAPTEAPAVVRAESLQLRVRELERFLHMLRGNQIIFQEPWVQAAAAAAEQEENSDEEE